MREVGNLVVEEKGPGVWWITINRPRRHNALSRDVLAQLADVVRSTAREDRSRVIVLTGSGERFFAAGGDLEDLSNVCDEVATIKMTNQARAALDAIRYCDVPVVAMLNGDAIGGGAELALACDMRMQAAHARTGFIQAKLAITSAWGGGPDLCELVGAARAMRMMSRCELIDAETALDWGLADAIVRSATREADINAFLDPITKCPPQVLRGIKAQTRACRQRVSLEISRSIEQRQLVATWLHQDHWQAAEAVLARGKK